MNEIEELKPEVMWFGRDGRRCFGTVHEPEAPSTRGVVFCNALGFEGELAQRALRHLAEDVTARGFWGLRFDYEGTGDSGGGPWEPSQLDAWLASIDDAVTMMRQRGVTDIRLVGFRMGASLAYLYATSHPGISGIVMWMPCARGAAWVRELRALSRLLGAARPPQRVTAERFPADSLEVAGFEFTAQTLAELADVDLLAAATPLQAPRVLVIDRIDAQPFDDLVGKIAASGAEVDHERMAGYADFVVDDEVNSILPWPTMHGIEDWLDDLDPTVPAPVPTGASTGSLAEYATLTVEDPTADRFSPPGPPRDSVVEEPLWVDGRLFAIASRPACRTQGRRVCIVLPNTGSTTRIGPGRLYVTLARYWASLGFTVLRVDLGGVGDSRASDPATDNKPHARLRIEELHDAVTWARGWTGYQQVVLFGLCSGAFNAFHVAIEGLDVDHLVLANPGIFYLGTAQTAVGSDEHALSMAYTFTRGLTNPRRWKLALQDREVLVGGLKNASRVVKESTGAGFKFLIATSARNAARKVGVRVKAPTPLARDLEQLIARGMRVLLIFATGESSAQYVRAFGGCDALVAGGGLAITECDGGDHIFSPPGARQWLTEVTTNYLERAYPFDASRELVASDVDAPPSDVRR